MKQPLRSFGKAHLTLVPLLLAPAVTGCGMPDVGSEDVTVRSEALVGQDEFLYLRCNATSWDADNSNRLESTSDPYTFQITYRVSEPWMVADGDSCQVVLTNERNGWGTHQTFFGARSGFTSVAVPGGAPLAQDGGNLTIHYPATGFYTVQINFRSGSFWVAAATPASAAAENANRFYSYLANRFGWSAVDNAGWRAPLELNMGGDNNSSWTGSSVLIGKADGVRTDSFAFSRDMIAHELTHAVTSYSSRLRPDGEAGAANEAFADAFAAFSTAVRDQVNWKIGESVWTPAIAGDTLRRMDDPHTGYNRETLGACQFDADRPFLCGQAAHLREYINSGVSVEHLNNGILNRATYLIVQGGTNEGIQVQGIGVRKAEQIYFRTLTQKLTRRSTLRDVRFALGQVCQSLVGQYGIVPADCSSISNALTSVGIEAPVLTGPAGISGKILSSGVPAQAQVVLAITGVNSYAITDQEILSTTTDASGTYTFSAAALAAALALPMPQIEVIYQVRYRNPNAADLTRVSSWKSEWFERVSYAQGTVVPTFEIGGLPVGTMSGSPAALPVTISWNHRTTNREYYRWVGLGTNDEGFVEHTSKIHITPSITVTATNVSELADAEHPFSNLATWYVLVTSYAGQGMTNRYSIQ